MANFRARTATFLATVTALLLVLLFGNSSYSHWVEHHAAGTSAGDLFLQQLAWPHWGFSGNDSTRNLFVEDLKAILVVVLTWVFVLLVGRGPWSGLRAGISHFLHGWAAYMFAGAFAGLIAAFFVSNASFAGALVSASAGVAYGLIVGWIVGLVTLASDG
jgi:hypothetical protein